MLAPGFGVNDCPVQGVVSAEVSAEVSAKVIGGCSSAAA